VSAAAVLVFIVLAPLAAAILALFLRGRVLAVLHVVAVPANAALALAVAVIVREHGPQRYAIGGWGAPLGIDLVADGATAVLLLLTAVIAGFGSVYARFYPGPLEPAGGLGRPLFWSLWYFLWASLNALFVSADIFNLYVALELITLSAVILVAQTGERPVLIAAMRYLLAALFGSLLYLLGVALLYGAVGALDLGTIAERIAPGPAVWAAAALMTVGLFLKTALFPFHFWLPPAHSHATAPVSALLSGVVLKAWFFLQVRLWLGPFAELADTEVFTVFGLLGAGAILWGALQAWREQRLKVIVAYSTVGQIGYVFLFFPLFSAVPATAWNGAFYQVLAHGCAKAAAFLAVGNILYALNSDRIDAIAGLGRNLHMSLLALALAGISLIGLPPSGGFVAKWLLIQAAIAAGMWHWVLVIIAGSLLAAVYIFRILGAAMAAPIAAARPLRPVPRALEVTALVLSLVAITLGVAPAPVLDLLAVGVPFDLAPSLERVQPPGFWLPILILFSSFFTGIATFFLSDERIRLRTVFNLFGAVLKVTLVTVLLYGVYQGHFYEARLAFLPGLDLVLRADPLSLLFVALSAGLWLLTTIYAIGYLEGAPDRSRFFGFFSLAVMASTGIALAGNLVTFLVFYEFLTLATYPLVVHRGNPRSLAAGRKYLTYTIAGGAAVLLGTVWLYTIGGDLEFGPPKDPSLLPGINSPLALTVIFALLIGGLGVKAALVPLHGWLPSAMVAPAPVSALLHAVAVVKAGVFGIIRVLYDIFGIGYSEALGGTAVLAVVAGGTIIYGSIRALQQDDIKRRLAFSTVSQLSYIALGAAIGGPLATIGAFVHIVHQGLMKITLFFCAGNLSETFGIHHVYEVDGIGRRMPWTMGAFTVAVFGMIGVPPLAGFISKWYLAGGAIDVGAWWVVGVLVASSVLNAAYFLPIVYAAWFRPLVHRAPPIRPLGWWLIGPPLVTAALSLAAGLFAASIISPLQWAEIIAERTYYGIAPEPAPAPDVAVSAPDLAVSAP
jgi:multicomponent Na+:H+ antiporter subunit D